MKPDKKILNKMSGHLFWDADLSEIDIERNAKYIIKKVLQYGFYSDWKILLELYGIKKITHVATQFNDLDKRTASFLSIVGNVPKHKFQCYSTKQSMPQHWNF